MGNQQSAQHKSIDAELEQLQRMFGSPSELISLEETFKDLAKAEQAMPPAIPRPALEDRLQLPLLPTAPPPVSGNSEVAVRIRNLGPSITTVAFPESLGPITRHVFLKSIAGICKQSSTARVQMLVSLFTISDKDNLNERTLDDAPAATASPSGSSGEGGFLSEESLRSLFLSSWLMMCHVRLRQSGGLPGVLRGEGDVGAEDERHVAGAGGANGGTPPWELPDVDPLVKAAFGNAPPEGGGPGTEGSIGGLCARGAAATSSYSEMEMLPQGCLLEAAQVSTWLVTYLPNLASCLSDFVMSCLAGTRHGATAAPVDERDNTPRAAAGADNSNHNRRRSSSSSERRRSDFGKVVDVAQGAHSDGTTAAAAGQAGDAAAGREVSSRGASFSGAGADAASVERGLLTLTTSWIVGLAQRGTAGKILVGVGCDPEGWAAFHPRLLYRASKHGRGMNRFTSHVDGYRDTVLMLVAASKTEEGNEGSGGWLLGAIVPGGFDNHDVFYGASGTCLLALKPRLTVLGTTGKESNYVYTHARMHGISYQARPTPDGIGFGGTPGKERLWLDDEFAKVTLRHHVVDKTYRPGRLVPEQGYAALEGKVEDVEVWGLGGKEADKQQNAHKQRETLFTEQRRKIDMKKFAAGWKEEKAMMDLLSNPNEPQREER